MANAPAKTAAAKTAAPKAAPKTTAKPATTKGAAPKPAVAKEPKVKPEVTKPTEGATLKPKDLVARVAESTGGKIKDVREAVLATLEQLGKSLDAGEALILPPLGKLRLMPVKGEKTPGVMRIKLQRGAGTKPAKKDEGEALAAAGEAS